MIRQITRTTCLKTLTLLAAIAIGAVAGTMSYVMAAVPDLPESIAHAESESRKISEGQWVLLEFHSPTCSTCRMMTPHVERLVEDSGETLSHQRVNVDETENAALLSAYGIESVPEYILYNASRKPVYRMAGMVSPTVLEKQVLRLMGQLPPVALPESLSVQQTLNALPAARTEQAVPTLSRILLLSFESAACTACKKMTPYLNGFEMASSGDLNILRIDTATSDGKALMKTLDIDNAPAYILMDDNSQPRGTLFTQKGAVEPKALWQLIQIFGDTGL